MVLTVRSDPERPAGGHALLNGEGLEDVATLTIENTYSGLFLGSDGRWVKQPHAFPVEHCITGALRLGPEIVDAIPTDLLLALRAGEGRDLGRLFWADVAPSRGRRSPAPPHPIANQPDPLPLPQPSESAVVVPPPSEPAVTPSRFGGARLVLAVVVLAAVAFGASLAVAMRFRPGRLSAGDACAAFAEPALRSEAADGGRVRRAEQALAAGCGSAAFASLDDADWQRSETAAWYLARFYDPNEGDPVYRLSAHAHAAWAAAYYRYWAARSPRQAAALATLCRAAVHPVADADLARACAP